MFEDKEIQDAIAELSETSLLCEIIIRITENMWNFGPEEDDRPVVVQIIQLCQENGASW